MQVYIDNIVFSLQKVGGISVYFAELTSRLMSSDNDVYFIEHKKTNTNIIRKRLNIPFDRIIVENYAPVNLLRYFPITINLNNYAIVHSTYFRTSINKNAVNITTVYDFNYELGYLRRGIRKYVHCRQKKQAVERADGVICISESTKRDLIRIYPHINPSKIKVIHLAASDEFYKINAEHPADNVKLSLDNILNKKYILFVGARNFHKNFDVCVDTVACLPDYELFIVGSKLSVNEIEMLESKLSQRYKAFSNVNSVELNYLYNNAFCFMYPTSYEGFGIPVLEAMQAGCPVVSTKFSSIPEVAGDAGLLVDNISPLDLAAKVKMLGDESIRNRAVSAGFEQARKFSWEKTYQQTIDFCHEVFEKKFGKATFSS